MPHELYIENGRASMFYVGQEPWHGLGTKLDGPATSAEAIRAAKLAWEVVKKPLCAVEDGISLPLSRRFAVVRHDLWGKPECRVLGIVGENYTPLQNREAFEFLDPIVGKGEAIYHTAGALRQGERVWILAKLPSDIRVIGDDIAEKYLLLSNSHDGESSVQIKFTPIRVVCQNTLTMALRQGPTVRVAHQKDVRQRLREAEKLLGLIHRRFDEIGQIFQAMTRYPINSDQLGEYLKLVFPTPSDPDDEPAFRRVREDRLRAQYFFANGSGNQAKGVSGTLWAAYNGVTEYIDHHLTRQTPDRRLDSIWFGGGYMIKARAFRVAESKTQASVN